MKEVIHMNNKGVGAIFCLIAAILTGVKYISAAVFMSGVSTWSADTFQEALGYVGSLPTILSIIALVIGIIFLGLGFVKDNK